jgi:hypothetical protein
VTAADSGIDGDARVAGERHSTTEYRRLIFPASDLSRQPSGARTRVRSAPARMSIRYAFTTHAFGFFGNLCPTSSPANACYGWKADLQLTRNQDGKMSNLTTQEIVFRTAGLWTIGMFAMAALSAYTARRTRERFDPLWLIIPFLLARIAVLLGPAGLALIVGRATSRWSETAAMVAIAAAVIAGYLASTVLVQIAQNVTYRLVGARLQPIRLWVQNKPIRRRTQRKG